MEIVANKRQQVAFFKVREGAYSNNTPIEIHSIIHALIVKILIIIMLPL